MGTLKDPTPSKKEYAQKYQQQYHKAHATTMFPFAPGDTVRIHNEKRAGEYGIKYNPLFSSSLYIMLEDYENGSYKIQNIKRDKPPETRNGKQLKKVAIRHEVDFHLHNDTISSTEVVSEVPDNEDSDDEDDEPTYVVHQIIGKKIVQGETYFKVWWKGYRKEASTWQPEADLKDCEHLIADYELAVARKKSQSRQ